MAKVRLAFVGVGAMGQCAHLRNYVTLPDCEVMALAELRPELGKKVAARYDVPRVYADHRELLAREKVDAIVHIQNFRFHGSTLPELLATGLPVLTEKPLASSAEVGRKLVDAAHRAGDRYLVAYHKRSDPAVMWARRQMMAWQKAEQVGKLRYVRLTMPPGDWAMQGFVHQITTAEKIPPLTPDPQPTGAAEKEYKEYLALVNYYIHQVNLMRHLLGEDYRAVFADRAGVLLVGQSMSGVTCTIEMAPWSNTLDWQESALIAFERGWIRIDFPAPLAIDQPGRVTVCSDPGKGVEATTSSPTLPHVHAMRQQAMNFVRAVRGEEHPLCSAAEALKDLEVMKGYQALLGSLGRSNA